MSRPNTGYFTARYKGRYTNLGDGMTKKQWKRKFMREKNKVKAPLFKLRGVNTIVADAGGIVNSLFKPSDPSSLQEWSNLSSLYDSYRVTGFKIQFFPFVPNGNSVNFDYKPLYTIMDVDQTTGTPVTTINQAIQYENVKVFNVYKPFKRYWKIPKYVDAANLQGGYFDVANASASLPGTIQFIGTGFDISATLGDIVITAYVKFKNRR